MHDKEYWITRIKEILDNQEPESYQLDFKSGEELLINRNRMVRGKPVPITRNEVIFDIVRDVSAMAHAAGGAIIYGIKEKNDHSSEADLIIPVKETDYLQKESLEQIITSNLLPPISAFQVLSIPGNEFNSEAYTANADEKLIVIEVERATTAHMVETNFGKNMWQKDNKISRRYYERVETQTFAMNGSRVEDVMNRTKKPKAIVTPFWTHTPIGDSCWSLCLKIENDGELVVHNWKCRCEMKEIQKVNTPTNPHNLIASNFFASIANHNGNRATHKNADGTKNFMWDYFSEFVLFPKDPIVLPHEVLQAFRITDESLSENGSKKLTLTIYADNMIAKPYTIFLEDIEKV